ncbi:MAG TPA: J domain-containing protein [Phototrophicaceae bacterium]|nr:J domain-containing protein [Phototrophicaceae bacterium]
MRFDTRRISAQLVNELQKGRPRLEVTYDGGDLIRVSLESNEIVQIYLIENEITVYEIRGIVAANTAIGIYTLFILWADLLLPIHGARFRPNDNDWMEALLALHGDKIYAYDAWLGEDFFIFPVYFEGAGAVRTARHGGVIDATELVGETVSTHSPLIAGVWRIANFEATGDTRPTAVVNSALSVYYRRLGIAENAGRGEVRQAYRKLARRFHPDLNSDPEATVRMQQINEAYERILDDMKQRGVPDDE